MIVLAGDIGGTNARLALFEVEPARAGGRPKLTLIFERTTPSRSAASLDEIAEAFLRAAESETNGRLGSGGLAAGGIARNIDGACLGIAGPIEHNRCQATNLPWVVDGRALAQRLGIEKVTLVNDFSAAALGVTAVGPEALAALGGGAPVPRGPIAVLGAGTGLGEAYLLWSESTGRYEVVPSEGGHADFAPRTPLEAGLLQYLGTKYGRVSCERVLSGKGLVDIFSFLSTEPACRFLIKPETAAVLAAPGGAGDGAAAEISRRGLEGSDAICEMSLALFCSVMGAVAGNLGLGVLATGGVFVAGGIAPRILGYLQKGGFREAFERKGRLHTLVERIPVFVVTHPQPGLLGAATIASSG
jgi:glucokinase